MSKQIVDETYAKAPALASGVTQALKDGVKHYNAKGELLTTAKEIIKCMIEEGGVTLKEPASKEPNAETEG